MRPCAAVFTSSNLSEAPNPSARESPALYLFVGLASMLGWIVLTLLILACSYWKINSILSESRSDNPAGNSRDVKPAVTSDQPAILHQPFAVIMAGEEKPTFIAMPSCSCPGSFDRMRAEEKSVQFSTSRSEESGQV